MSNCKKKTDQSDDPRTQSSSTDDDFYGFSSGKNNCGSRMVKLKDPKPNQKNNHFTEEQVLKLQCIECKEKFSTADLMMDKTTYDILISMENWGSRWHCFSCLYETNPLKLDNHQDNKTLDKTKKNEIDKIQIRINELQTTMDSKLNTLIEKLNTSTTTKPSEGSSKSWAEIVCGDETITSSKPSWANVVTGGDNKTNEVELIRSLAKKVLNDQKQQSADRTQRENNVIMFNVADATPEETDDSYFKTLCKHTLEMDPIPEVKMSRIGEKRPDYNRPIKVIFTQNWDKRKFLSKMFKTKNVEKYNKLRVSHDMSEDDRQENKRLLKDAYQRNQDEKPTKYKYKVRGPPWRMQVVKVYSKN